MKKIVSILLSISILCGSGILVAADTLENEGTTVYYEIETDEDVLLEMAIEQAKERTITARSATENTEEFMVDQLESETTYPDGSKVEQHVATSFNLMDKDLNRITPRIIESYTETVQDGYIDCYISTTVRYEKRDYDYIRPTQVSVTPHSSSRNRITKFVYGVNSTISPTEKSYWKTGTIETPTGMTYTMNTTDAPFHGLYDVTTYIAGAGEVYVNGKIIYNFQAIVDLLTILWLDARGHA